MKEGIEELSNAVIVEFRDRLPQYAAETLQAVHRGSGTVEAAAMLLQYLVLEEFRFDSGSVASSFWRELRESRHPLAWLPLGISEIEAWAGLSPGAFRQSAAQRFDVKDDATEIPAAMLRSRMDDAFTHWTQRSNGQVEAREFLIRSDVTLRECVGACVQRSLNCSAASIDAVEAGHGFFNLSQFIRADGAYTSHRNAARARLQTWRLVQAALNCPPEASVDEIDEAARKAMWYVFTCDWFCDVAWDCGVALVRPDHHAVVLAATDTD
ncbi:MAG TPA: DUF6183 family protein [Tepidisphaeraceae bacterium]|nr:DUF6183 family protein [Tepidisphaeraceae bacterium]